MKVVQNRQQHKPTNKHQHECKSFWNYGWMNWKWSLSLLILVYTCTYTSTCMSTEGGPNIGIFSFARTKIPIIYENTGFYLSECFVWLCNCSIGQYLLCSLDSFCSLRISLIFNKIGLTKWQCQVKSLFHKLIQLQNNERPNRRGEHSHSEN